MACLSAVAGSPTYTSLTGSGTTSAEVIFPADPVLQVRVVGLIGSSDKATSKASFWPGSTLVTVTYTNSGPSSTNIYVGGYTGIATNDLIVVSTGATNRTLTVYGLANNTNLMVTGALGFALTPNAAQVFDLGSAAGASVGIGANTNKVYASEAIYVAPRGRPLRVVLDGTAYSSLDSVTAHYDQ